MEFWIAVYITLMLVLGIKLVAKAIRGGLNPKVYVDNAWWVIVGCIIVLNALALVGTMLTSYIHLIVKATL